MAHGKRSKKITPGAGAYTPREHLAILYDHLAQMKAEGFKVSYLPLPQDSLGIIISLDGAKLSALHGIPKIDGESIE